MNESAKDGVDASNIGAKPKLLLIAYRAFGDWLYTVPLLPYLFERYEVYLETNIKCFQLVHNDPRFKWVSVFGYEAFAQSEWETIFPKRWEAVKEAVKPDRVLNLNGTLEVTCIAERWQKEFSLPIPERQQLFGKTAFIDAVFERAEIPVPENLKLDELYYDETELAWGERWKKSHEKDFVVIIPIAGSTSQKVFHNWLDVANGILERYENAVVYASGDEVCGKLVPQHPRIRNMCGNNPIKQSFLMAKYADMVIGPETGMLVAAGMWGTPKIMLGTTSSLYQMTKYHKNDFSLQAPIYCSPCHRAIYCESDCHEMRGDREKQTLYPACSKTFSTEKILEIVGGVYERSTKNLRRDVSGSLLSTKSDAAR